MAHQCVPRSTRSLCAGLACFNLWLRRFELFGVRVVHRVGLLQPQDQIVLVAVTSAHRGQGFQA